MIVWYVVCLLSAFQVIQAQLFSTWTDFEPSASSDDRQRRRFCTASTFQQCLLTDYFYEEYTNCPLSCTVFNVTITRTACAGECDLATVSRFSECIADNQCQYEQRWYCLNGRTCTGSWSTWAVTETCNKLCGRGNTTRTRECTESGTPSARCQGAMGNTSQSITETCNSHSCPFYSPWSDFTTCSQSCGGGTQSRNRTCYDENGIHPTGVGCGSNNLVHEEEMAQCNSHSCPQYDPWVDGTCSFTCGGGTLVRTRTCKYRGSTSNLCPGADGSGMQSETVSCNSQDCPSYGPWVPGLCSVTCGIGVKNFSRECMLNGAPSTGCSGASTKQEPCDEGACPCSSWSSVGSCSEPCDEGRINQTRECGGVVETQEVNCNTEVCTYGSWMDVSSCDVNCGGGTKNQERHCTVTSCDKVETRQTSCNTQACGCTSWMDSSICTLTCGNGTMTQYRNCTGPTSHTRETRTILCNTVSCDCDAWSDLTNCSAMCGGGNKTQERFCQSTATTEQQVITCNTQACECLPWTDDTNCSVTCGGGQKLQGRQCDTPAEVVQENRTVTCNTETCVGVAGGSFTWLVTLASIVGAAFVIALIYLCIPFCCVCCVIAGDRRVTAISALVINSIQVGSLGMIQWRGKTRLKIKTNSCCWGFCACCGKQQEADGDNIPMVRIFGTSDQNTAEEGAVVATTSAETGMTQVGLGGDDANVNDLTAWASQMMNESKEISATEVYELNNATGNNNSSLQDNTVRSHQSLLQPSQPTTAHMLNHVNNLRKTGLPKSSNIFSQDSIIACLVHVQQHCDESCQSRFSDLFALVNDSDDEILLRDLRASRKRIKTSHRSTSKSKSSQSNKRNSDDSNSGSSTDEEDAKKKRRRKVRTNDSSDSE